MIRCNHACQAVPGIIVMHAFLGILIPMCIASELNIGVQLLRQPFQIRPNHGYGMVLIHATLPEADYTVESFHCNSNSTGCVDSTILDSLITEAMRKTDAEYEVMRNLVEYFRMRKLNKRAFANFIGDASKYLFGTATESDLKAVYLHMQEMFDKMTKISSEQIADHLAAVGTKLDSQFSAITHSLRADAAEIVRIDRVTKENRQAINLILRREHMAFDIKLPQLEKLEHLQNRLQQWNKGLMVLRKGRLPRQIVHHKELRLALKRLHEQVSLSDSSAGVAMDLPDILNIYDMDGCEALFLHDQLFIRLSVPLIKADTSLTIYKAVTHPVPIQSTGGYTKILLNRDYIAVNTDGTYYVELTEADLQICRRQAYFCPTINNLMSARHPSCMLSILYNHPHKTVVDLCHPRVYSGRPEQATWLINDTHIIVQTPEKLANIHCPHKPSFSVPLARSQIVRVPCGCFLSTDSMTTTPKFCVTTTNVTIAYPFNLPVYDNLKDSISADDLLQLNRPDPASNIPNLEKIINATSDPHFGANLKDVMKKVHQLASDQSWDNIMTDFDLSSWPLDWPEYTGYAVIGIWLCALTALHLHSWMRLRTLQAILLTRLPVAQARPIFPIDNKPKTGVTQLHLPLVIILTYLMLAIVLLYCLNALIQYTVRGSFKLYRNCQCLISPDHQSGQWDLFLKVSDNKCSRILFLTTIPAEGVQTLITDTPTCETAELHYALSSHLRFRWTGQLKYSVNGHVMMVTLPQEIMISNATASQLRQILSHQCTYSLVCRTGEGPYIAVRRSAKDRPFCPATNNN